MVIEIEFTNNTCNRICRIWILSTTFDILVYISITGFDTSADGLLVLDGIIRSVVSVRHW